MNTGQEKHTRDKPRQSGTKKHSEQGRATSQEHSATGNQPSDHKGTSVELRRQELCNLGASEDTRPEKRCNQTVSKPGPATTIPDPRQACTIPNTARKIQLCMKTSSLLESKYAMCQVTEIYLQKQTFVPGQVAPSPCDNVPYC